MEYYGVEFIRIISYAHGNPKLGKFAQPLIVAFFDDERKDASLNVLNQDFIDEMEIFRFVGHQQLKVTHLHALLVELDQIQMDKSVQYLFSIMKNDPSFARKFLESCFDLPIGRRSLDILIDNDQFINDLIEKALMNYSPYAIERIMKKYDNNLVKIKRVIVDITLLIETFKIDVGFLASLAVVLPHKFTRDMEQVLIDMNMNLIMEILSKQRI
ncbi:hypothetical protein ROZALSC1DRAFT_28634 [Rozella allomycis CSF55]|uniref:Uncharacterized protein n=1 Tax=Rozella allomycis (strain CSF55) TaxID=988480 RepID=A0A075B262_ROZAC|nr:hypothetical protein O9G_003769 [Rozella allomycis CSF55]RKP19811.1 hypothetical protein ROZALSC1DRAFT_28634 [Rozella allomycis CSF55]|eukprot:EPZ36655.1 hypothetical protein O9G_003769 [Rozella allomycis CSF55]